MSPSISIRDTPGVVMTEGEVARLWTRKTSDAQPTLSAPAPCAHAHSHACTHRGMHDGRISWSEFLSFLNQSEARKGVSQPRSRRSSMGMGLNATTKVQRRLELRRFFNRLDVSHDGSVSLYELTMGLEQNPEIAAFFDGASLRQVQQLAKDSAARSGFY